VYLTDGVPPVFATVTVTNGDGSGGALKMQLTGTGAGAGIYTDAFGPDGGCLTADATLEPAVAHVLAASTGCLTP